MARGPGIHNPRACVYGFRARRCAAPRNDDHDHVTVNVTSPLTSSHNRLHTVPARSSEGAFRVRTEVWSERGACGRFRKPFPGGSRPPLGRHHDRPPRSSVDWRQAKTGNARRAGSQETRELELSQGWMRSAWRVPRWSAGRRARRDKARCRTRCIGGRQRLPMLRGSK